MTKASATEDERTRLSNSTYNIIRALEKDADFLYSTVDKYIDDAHKDNRTDLVNVWNTMKQDKQKHLQLLKEALSKEAKENRLQR
jgi:vacuolar-type H+-ATPase subunit H